MTVRHIKKSGRNSRLSRKELLQRTYVSCDIMIAKEYHSTVIDVQFHTPYHK